MASHFRLPLCTTYLRCRGYIAPGKSDIGRPRDVAHPVPVPLEGLLLDPRLGVLAERPYLDEVVAPGAGEAFEGRGGGWRPRLMGLDKRAGVGSRGPRDSIAANGVAVKNIGDPLTVVWKKCLVERSRHKSRAEWTFESEHGKLSIGRGACQDGA